MTIITTSVVKTGLENAVELTYGGFSFIGSGITVASQQSVGVFSSAGGVELHSYGSIIGVGAITLEKGGNSIRLGETSVVHGFGDAIAMGGPTTPGNSVVNYGIIEAGNSAIRSYGNGTTVTNYGRILGGKGITIFAGDGSNDPNKFWNKGNVSVKNIASENSTAYQGSQVDDTVINDGAIRGHISLMGGHNLYDGRNGSIEGVIFCDGGYDTIYGGAQSETVNVSYGTNYVNGYGGQDTIQVGFKWWGDQGEVALDLRTTTSQETGYGKSTILNFENIQTLGSTDKLTGNEASNVISSGNGIDTLDGWFGDDTLDGGDGVDTALFSGSVGARADLTKQGQAQNTGYGFDTLYSIENLEGGAGADWFKGDGGANVLTGHGGNDTLIGGLGDDTLDGGSGLNTALFAGAAAASQITNNGDGTFTVIGPDGTDLVKSVRLLQFADTTTALWNAAPTALGLSKSIVSEDAIAGTIVATLSAVDADGDRLSYSLAAGSPFRLDGANLVLAGSLDFETTASHSLTVVARDAYGGQVSQTFTLQVADAVEETPFVLTGTAGADRLEGEAGNDVLTGLGGNDMLLGEAGNDKLSGGAGRDVLTGGTGQDIFVFDSRPNKSTNLDRITDFSVADDTIQLKKSVFTRMAKKDEIKAGEFYKGTKAHDVDDRLIYNKKTGALFYDADGTGSQAQIQIATLSKNLKMTYKDFFVI